MKAALIQLEPQGSRWGQAILRLWLVAGVWASAFPGDSAPMAVPGLHVPGDARVAVLAREPSIVRPAALALDSRGRAWVLEHAASTSGGGRLQILVDSDADGAVEAVITFVGGLKDATGLALGQGGVFIGAASRLLFLADADSNDVPDGPPTTLVDGFGEVALAGRLHSFTWGPDGWLYGCHAGSVLLHGAARDCGIWRWHAASRTFEIVGPIAPGARGLSLDAAGRPRCGRFPPTLEGWDDLALDPRFDWTAAAVTSDGAQLFLLDGQLSSDCDDPDASSARGRVIVVRRDRRPFAPGLQPTREKELWSRFAQGKLDEAILSSALADPAPSLRAAAVRIAGEMIQGPAPTPAQLERLASLESDLMVRRELESFCGKLAGRDASGLRKAAKIAGAARLACAGDLQLDEILLDGSEAAVSALTSFWQSAPDDSSRSRVLERFARLSGSALDRLVLGNWPTLSPALRARGVSAMASREASALELLAAIDAGKVPAAAITADDARRMMSLESERVRLALDRSWGRVARATSTELERRRQQLESALAAGTGSFERGALVFEKRCAKCHELHGKGHRVGPRLDETRRDDLAWLVRSIVDPNDEVRREFYSTGVLLRDGQFVQGILVSRAGGQVTLRREEGLEESHPEGEIRKLIESGVSLMPEGLTNDLPVSELRDLISYLDSTPAISTGSLAGPFRADAGKDPFELGFPPELPAGDAPAASIAWRGVDRGAVGRFDGKALGLCRPGEVAYLRAVVVSAEPAGVDWILDTNASVRVQVGSRRVFEGRADDSLPARTVRFNATLSPGPTVILIKIVRPGWAPLEFRLRRVDPAGKTRLEAAR